MLVFRVINRNAFTRRVFARALASFRTQESMRGERKACRRYSKKHSSGIVLMIMHQQVTFRVIITELRIRLRGSKGIACARLFLPPSEVMFLY
jgi:hypothetical protein